MSLQPVSHTVFCSRQWLPQRRYEEVLCPATRANQRVGVSRQPAPPDRAKAPLLAAMVFRLSPDALVVFGWRKRLMLGASIFRRDAGIEALECMATNCHTVCAEAMIACLNGCWNECLVPGKRWQ